MALSSLDAGNAGTAGRLERAPGVSRKPGRNLLHAMRDALWRVGRSLYHFLEARSKTQIWIASILMSCCISYVEYRDHLRLSIVLFYMVPIILTAWFAGYRGAMTLVMGLFPIWLFSITMKGDHIANVTFAVNRFIFFTPFAIAAARFKDMHHNLEALAEKRAQALMGEAAERARLEREMLEISEREQRRIGQDLHDGLCQQLTGTAMLGQAYARKLADPADKAGARKIVDQIEHAIFLARGVAKGLDPVETRSDGLMQAFEEFSETISDLFGVICKFECDLPVLIGTPDVAGHLFRIAQEAVSNAIKHGKAKHILISLKYTETGIELSIVDDGNGFSAAAASSAGGMGLRTMSIRAKMVGGQFSVMPHSHGGVQVICLVPENLDA